MGKLELAVMDTNLEDTAHTEGFLEEIPFMLWVLVWWVLAWRILSWWVLSWLVLLLHLVKLIIKLLNLNLY